MDDQTSNKKKSFGSYCVLAVNLLVTGLLAFWIKESDADRLFKKVSDEEKETVLLGQDVMKTQNQILVDRENKLRKLNTTPLEERKDETVRTTVTTPPPAPEKDASSSSSDSKSSSSSSSSTSKPKPDKETKSS